MKTLALFNNKGGVGKTTLTYHLAHMLQRLGYRVLAVDLDPQANLTSSFLDDGDLAELWGEPEDALAGSAYPRRLPGTGIMSGDTGTVAAAIEPLLDQTGDVRFFDPAQIRAKLSLVPGDLELSRFEDKLSDAWPRCFTGSDKGALRVSTAFHRIIQDAGERATADIALIDVGPNLGAINRSALLAADCVLMPLAADLYSLRGLRNLGPSLRDWRRAWQDTVIPRAPKDMRLPAGTMEPIGYVIMQPVMRLSRPVRAYEPWLRRIPEVYATSVLGEPFDPEAGGDYHIATMPNYQSLMPLAHDARKPMFDLRAGDGALGATQAYVDKCYQDFRRLAKAVAARLEL
ncbi:ParA family protein [Actinocrinis puniceicyclus]|uniref:ParA family protein n=1 Tax=Actinocrinis puniceicyclus TaxID=977794 RepID=A0A8J7WGX2_9ACTN|nr:ParA family protein [Actinocrinis puniceicyclus]MBS2961931.1 ParA family protein [Actinocrinis puniceicyclus]